MTRRTDRIAATLRNAPVPELLRVNSPGTTAAAGVDREAGRFGAGLIRGFSLITRGEALGHELWIDQTFLEQVADALNAAGAQGIKSRFTHPDMSNDGLSKYLGRVKSGSVLAGRVLGNLHLAAAAHRSPDGDLAGYVMDRAVEDAESFGPSIVFYHDMAAETQFMLDHGAVINERGFLDVDNWRSPDPDNVDNYRHARLACLEAVDVVDAPAANPGGMFSDAAGPVGEFAQLADYALGLTDQAPASTALSVHPDRLRGFVSRYLSNRSLSIAQGGPDVTTESTPAAPEPAAELSADAPDVTQDTQPAAEPLAADQPAETPEAPATPEPAAELSTDTPAGGADRPCEKYCAAFGPEAGFAFFRSGTPFAEAQQQYVAQLRADNAQLQEQLAIARTEHPAPLATDETPAGKSLKDLTKIK